MKMKPGPALTKIKCELCGYRYQLRVWDEVEHGARPSREPHKQRWTICLFCETKKKANQQSLPTRLPGAKVEEPKPDDLWNMLGIA